MKPVVTSLKRILILSGLGLLMTSCGGQSGSSATVPGLTKIRLQTDWYAQPEHGGFYQALVKGFYQEVGLDVEIIPGGPNALTVQKVAHGAAEFAIGRSDDVIIAASRQIPLVIHGALMQHDPQGIMFHQESGIESFEDLDGKTIMANPGSSFIRIMENTYDIDIDIMPLDYGMHRFLADKDFIQQCFITNEPYYVGKEGANYGILLLSKTGFSPYRVWYSSRGFARANPELVKAFTEASIRGWNNYLAGDRSEANDMIASRNPQQTPDFMDFVISSMIEHKLVTGNLDKGEETGLIKKERIQLQIDQLAAIDMLESPVAAEDILPDDFSGDAATGVEANSPGLVLKLRTAQSSTTQTIGVEEMRPLAKEAKLRFFQEEGVERMMSVVYLSDFIEAFVADEGSDYWLANCTDGYQSNYYPELLDTIKPFLIISIEGQPLQDWVDRAGHSEWGPHIINIANEGTLLDPTNKNPWGVVEVIATNRRQALKGWADHELDESARAGREIYLNSCTSCHRSATSLVGGTFSTRPLPILAAFAAHAEPYFRRLLRNPTEANPMAERMPSFAHYNENEVSDLISFLKSVPQR